MMLSGSLVNSVFCFFFFNYNILLYKGTVISYPFLCAVHLFTVLHFYDADAVNILVSIKSLMKKPK